MKFSNFFFTILATFSLYSATVSAQTLSISVGEADYDGVFDETSITLAAAFPINESFAVEVAYNDLGEVSSSQGSEFASLEASSFDVTLIGSIPLNEKVNFFGKIGIARWEIDGSFNIDGISGSGSVDGTDLTFGAGLEMVLNKSLSGNIQLQRYDAELGGESLAVDKISFGLSFDL